jgi:hypothetical protein
VRRPGDGGPFYSTYLEGIDNDGDGRYNEDRLGGIDPNRNYPGNWSIAQGGSGPFAGSELELRAMLDFAVAHPNIAASQHFHSSGGVVLHPPSVPDLELPSSDEDLYLSLSRLGLEVTGYDLATSVYDWNWPRGSRNTKGGQVYRDADGDVRGWPVGENDAAYPAYGGSIDGLYLLFGVLAFANEIYQMAPDRDGDGRVDAAEQLSYDDEEMDGATFKEWAAFEHPQLGAVEIGGWRKFGQNNPVGDRIAEEVRRNVDFVMILQDYCDRPELRNTAHGTRHQRTRQSSCARSRCASAWSGRRAALDRRPRRARHARWTHGGEGGVARARRGIRDGCHAPPKGWENQSDSHVALSLGWRPVRIPVRPRRA